MSADRAQNQARQRRHAERHKRRVLDAIGLHQPRCGQPERPGAVVVGTPDAVRVVIGIIHANNQEPANDYRWDRSYYRRLPRERRGPRTCDNGGKAVGPGVRAGGLEPIAGGHCARRRAS